MPRILIIEDEYALAAALSTVVRRLGAEPVVAASGQGGIEKAQRQGFDAVLLDIGLPDMSGLKVLSALRAGAEPPPVLIITAHGTLENALEARRLGAHDYFLKPLNLAELQACLRTLIATEAMIRPMASAITVTQEGVLMIGAAPGMQRCFAVVAQACATEVPVLLSGPRGSGKTLAAQVIHRNSAHAAAPLIAFRCDEWPATEAEQALARALEQAGGGTLLIEEIGALPLPLQAQMMREISAEPAAGPSLNRLKPELRTGLRTRTRVLATSALPLRELISTGRFREDLFYQLSVLQISLPPLAERLEDIAALAAYWLGRAAPARELSISADALARLKGYAWPGNVRELVAAMQHAAAVCPGATVLPRHLPESIAEGQANGAGHLETTLHRALTAWLDHRLTGAAESLPDYDTLLAQVEKLILAEVLARYEDRPTHLAAALNMNRATLRRKLRELLGRE